MQAGICTPKPLLLLLAGALAGAAGCSKSDDRKAKGPMPGHDLAPKTRALIFDTPVETLDGKPSSLESHDGKALLVVNVASKCGLTPQYEGLQRLQEKYGDQGFAVVGFPCNQFGKQEPGSPEEIQTFCDQNYGVTFPLYEKIEVNGEGRHPIYQGLTSVEDKDGEAGDIEWNFEKFVISADRKRIARFRPKTEPEDPSVVAAVEAALPK